MPPEILGNLFCEKVYHDSDSFKRSFLSYSHFSLFQPYELLADWKILSVTVYDGA